MMSERYKQVYFAKLAEQAKQFDEMAGHMESVVKLGHALSAEERSMLSVAWRERIKGRMTPWKLMRDAEQLELSNGNVDNAALASEYCNNVEGEVQKVCNVILGLLDQSLIPKASDVESKVFYEKMKKFYQKLMVLAEWSPPERAGL